MARPGAQGRALRSSLLLVAACNPTATSSVYTPSGTALWSSGIAGHPGATAVLTAGGRLVIVSPAGVVLWTSG
jgi:hypothetical protein